MSYKVTYNNKSGQQESVIFANLSIAEAFVKRNPGAIITPSEIIAPSISIKKLGGPVSEAAKKRAIKKANDANAKLLGEAIDFFLKEESKEEPAYVCACGKEPPKGRSTCYTCVRYK